MGKWIGLKDGEVVVISDTHGDLYRELREKGTDEVYFFILRPKRRRRSTASFSKGF